MRLTTNPHRGTNHDERTPYHFCEQRPFEPFTLLLADGRELHVDHPDFAQIGRAAMFVIFHYHDGQVEVIDALLIVSIRTIYAADLADFSEPRE